jgi:hypothetical protein
MKALVQSFTVKLFAVIQGSIQAYLGVTEKLPEAERDPAWQEYNQSFDEHIMAQVLEVLKRNNCGIAEVCHAGLKLLDIGARMAGVADAKNPNEEPFKAWFVGYPGKSEH